MASSSKKLRSKGKLEDSDLFEAFPKVEAFHKDKLPLFKEVIGLVRYLAEETTFDDAISAVTSRLHDHWVSRNIYPVTWQMIKKKLAREMTEFRYITRTHSSKRGETWERRYQEFKTKQNTLFDVFCENDIQRQTLEEKYGIPMLDEDYQYLQSMRTDRIGKCESRIDSQWHRHEEMKKQCHARYIQRQHGETSTIPSSNLTLTVNTESEDSIDDSDPRDPDFETDNPVSNGLFLMTLF